MAYIGGVAADEGEKKKVNGRKNPRSRGESPFVTALRQFADVQGGYILAGQAEEIGVSRQLMSLYRKEGGPLIRYVRGLYRMRDFPESPFDRIIGEWYDTGIRIEAVISHESAAAILGLLDEVPYEVHMTAPKKYRLRRPPRGDILYFVNESLPELPEIPESAVFRHAGVPVTDAERTIVDLLDSRNEIDFLAGIVARAVAKRMTTITKLREAAGERSPEALANLEAAWSASRNREESVRG